MAPERHQSDARAALEQRPSGARAARDAQAVHERRASMAGAARMGRAIERWDDPVEKVLKAGAR